MSIRCCLEAQHTSVEIVIGNVLVYMVMQFLCWLFVCLPSEGSRTDTLHKISSDHSGVSRSEWDILHVPVCPIASMLWKAAVLHMVLSTSMSVKIRQRECRVLPPQESHKHFLLFQVSL